MALTITPARRCGHYWRVKLLQAGLLLGLVFAGGVQAGELGPAREFQIKAVFLFNFAQFVEWPQSAFSTADSPLVIGVLGADPFGDFIDELVRGESVRGHSLTVQRYRSLAEIGACHVLFVSGSEGSQISRIVAALKGRPVLTVCDWEAYARNGVMIRFLMERNHVRLRIDLEEAKAAGLIISSKLLRSAEIVAPPKN